MKESIKDMVVAIISGVIFAIIIVATACRSI